jgi:histidine triad (HIT) family protein
MPFLAGVSWSEILIALVGLDMTESDCLFCKISSGEIPADVVFESEDVVAFRDINPKAPTHVLIIPRKHVATINEMTRNDIDDVGKLFLAAGQIAKDEGIDVDGYRVTMNCNEAAGQTVFHLHLHLLGGRRMNWPPG